jgi:beta-galactosidase
VKAKVQFEGEHAPSSTEISFESIAPDQQLLYKEKPWKSVSESQFYRQSFKPNRTEEEKRKALEEVEKQQTRFGENF